MILNLSTNQLSIIEFNFVKHTIWFFSYKYCICKYFNLLIVIFNLNVNVAIFIDAISKSI